MTSPVTLEELNQYIARVAAEARLLGVYSENDDSLLWHYTDAKGIIGIISSHQFRMTANDCLNDSTEIEYAEALYRAAIRKLEKLATSGEQGQDFLKRMLEYVDNSDQPPENAGETWHYISCFSEKQDDLSQWRAYGDTRGSNGYALAFRKSKHPFTSVPLRVNYNTATHTELADRMALATMECFFKGLAVRPDAIVSEWYGVFIDTWGKCQYWLAPLVKHESFHVEHEYRFIERKFESSHDVLLDFQPKRSFIARYLLHPQYATAIAERNRLPIAEVMVGPGNHQREAGRSVQALLRKHGYDCPVTFSRCPAQRE